MHAVHSSSINEVNLNELIMFISFSKYLCGFFFVFFYRCYCDRHSSDEDSADNTDVATESSQSSTTLRRCTLFLGRVMRTALPIQALMLLLLGVASLIPVYEGDYQCSLSNNFARSLDPMLQYKDGPPPF